MKPLTRSLIAVAALLLAVLYVLPLWRISLKAPQYPEGLGLVIYLDRIGGMTEFDLQSINTLNHYVGMKAIVPDAIPELSLMPWLVGGLIVLGLAAAASGRRWFAWGWVGAFILLMAVGLADFWAWGYDYGHDLDPKAIMKIPDMTYQPPLIGTKKLLNIEATSLPDLGGIVIGVSLLLAIGALLWERRRPGRSLSASPSSAPEMPEAEARGGRRLPVSRPTAGVAGLLVILLASCAPSAGEIPYGASECALCRMAITDQRFGAEAVTAKGKLLYFDSIECLVNFVLGRDAGEINSLWVTDFSRPGTLIEATSARYLQSESLPSPMGENLSAFADDGEIEMVKSAHPGNVLGWNDLNKAIAEK